MTFTYDPTLATTRDKIRFLTGDVLVSDQLLSDEEIAAVAPGGVFGEADLFAAAARCCRAIAANCARLVDVSAGGASAGLTAKQQQFEERARKLETESAKKGGTAVKLGGASISEKRSAEQDTDRVQPAFTRELGRYLPDGDERRWDD